MIFSFVWLCVFYNGVVPVVPCLALCSRVFFSPVKHNVHLAWGRENWSVSISGI